MPSVDNVVTIGGATLYHGDCLEILPTLDKADQLQPHLLPLVMNRKARWNGRLT